VLVVGAGSDRRAHHIAIRGRLRLIRLSQYTLAFFSTGSVMFLFAFSSFVLDIGTVSTFCTSEGFHPLTVGLEETWVKKEARGTWWTRSAGELMMQLDRMPLPICRGIRWKRTQ
jgi:hypothetical protein